MNSRKIIIENVIAVIASSITAMIFSFNCNLHPWNNGESLTDSSVFRTVAMMIEKGYMPYVHSFDHKGPYQYIINWFGDCLSKEIGIWLLEVLFLSITVFALYKTARLNCSIFSSVIVTFAALSLLFPYFEGGNLTEEYAMPLLAIALFIFLDYLKNDRITKYRIILSGACFGIVLLLRPNMITVWAVFCCVVSARLIIQKNYKKLINFVILFVSGMTIVVFPVALWLWRNGDLSYCFQDYILFNLQYTSAEGGRALFPAKWSAFFKFFNSTVFIVAFFSMIFHLKKKDLQINLPYIIYLLATIIFIVMSGMSYGHYGMVLIPAVIYPLSLIFSDIEKIRDRQTSKTIDIFVALYTLSVIIVPNWIGIIEGIPKKYDGREKTHKSEVVEKVTDIIAEKTHEEQKISVYGNWDIIYVVSNRLHATRYSYQFPIGEVAPDILTEYFAALEKEQPAAVVVQEGKYDDRIKKYLEQYDYQLAYASDVNNVGNGAQVYLK